MKGLAVIAGIALVSCLAGGCGRRPDTDVTTLPKYGFASFAGTVWKTKVRLAVARLERHTYLLAPMHFDDSNPSYNPPPYMHILSFVPAGARVRIDRLMKDNNNWGGVWVVATLDGGTPTTRSVVCLDERLLVDNTHLDPGESLPKTWSVAPDMLESETAERGNGPTSASSVEPHHGGQ